MSAPLTEQNSPANLEQAKTGGKPAAGSADGALAAMAQARDIAELERMRRAVEATGGATYHWHISSDEMLWNSEAAKILDVSEPDNLSTGRKFADLLDSENTTSRFEVVMRSHDADNGSGVPYCIEYRMRPHGRQMRKAIWVEDSGRWFAGADGKPAEAFGVIRRVDDRHHRDERLEFLSSSDPLTGMMNRGRLSDELSASIAHCKEQNQTCALLIAVINNLAVVNDAYGFDVADEVIVAVGHKLRRVVRQHDHIARYSGAKFAILLNDCTEEEVSLAAERFLRVARDSVIETDMGPVWAMLSIGGIFLPKHAETANAALACCEEALAEAKRKRNDNFVIFEPSPERLSVRELNARCAAEIVGALREERFSLAFQPIVDAASGEVASYEALLRMKCDGDSVIEASHLIPIAEKLGLVRLIDQSVVRMAVRVLRKFEQTNLAVNVSGATATDPRWFIELAQELAENAEVASRIIIEVNEAALLGDIESGAAFINRVRELGCRVAIDDFGAGFSAFRNLKALNVNMVKLDGTYCEQLSSNQESQYFVRSLIDLARKFDLQVVAEWVETEEDAAILRDMGVDYLQGKLFGEPMLVGAWSDQASAGKEDDERTVLPRELVEAGVDPCVPATPAGDPADSYELPTFADDETGPARDDEQPGFDASVERVARGVGEGYAVPALPALPLEEEAKSNWLFETKPDSQDIQAGLASEASSDDLFVPVIDAAGENCVTAIPQDDEQQEIRAEAVTAGEEASGSPAAGIANPFASDRAEAADTEPALDLSRLKSAMSALDARFDRSTPEASGTQDSNQAADVGIATGDQEEQTADEPALDIAKAISSRLGT